jgi:hypothetical protein
VAAAVALPAATLPRDKELFHAIEALSRDKKLPHAKKCSLF